MNHREAENHSIVLTEDFAFYIIEVGKMIKNSINTELDSWINFINNPQEEIDMSNKELKKAKDELEKISQDEHERYLAELREKYIRDQMAVEDAGYDKGFKAGIESGIERGIHQRNRQIAKTLKAKGLTIAEICEITGLSKDDVINFLINYYINNFARGHTCRKRCGKPYARKGVLP